MMTQREQLLRELTAMQECQAEVRPRLEGRDRWLTPWRAAMMEAVLVGVAFLLCGFVLLLAQRPVMSPDGLEASSHTAVSQTAPRQQAVQQRPKAIKQVRERTSDPTKKGNGVPRRGFGQLERFQVVSNQVVSPGVLPCRVPPALLVDETVFDRIPDDLGLVSHPELLQNPGPIHADRGNAHSELLCNSRKALSVGEQL